MKGYRPDGYVVSHIGSNFQADFGPFKFKEAKAFVKEQRLGRIVPLFRTADWDRDSELRRGRARLVTRGT